MILLLLRNLLLFAFGIALYFLWRAAEPPERWLKWIVATGFLARAVAGQALFWISWTCACRSCDRCKWPAATGFSPRIRRSDRRDGGEPRADGTDLKPR